MLSTWARPDNLLLLLIPFVGRRILHLLFAAAEDSHTERERERKVAKKCFSPTSLCQLLFVCVFSMHMMLCAYYRYRDFFVNAECIFVIILTLTLMSVAETFAESKQSNKMSSLVS